ncbi:MAG: hypothetical protein UT55_C0076G0004 [Candidatus Peregrinibacteria bacterium GW2011_GWE2_39_6]|nr:MAG: hypothetical protein UT36_C0007G0035 [Candidatus Peregrinibacteria bacterium GW2011_GWF2_39_17]KKR24048.1 MAG: hypothetical protein UT55_C0076G0004 [Candidatus Peregrinibacteria bacterium GW2011_GWE2_39_6]HCW31898.1 hypothetical protein [Candidatus Peregrinibacteria bacterium]
MKKKSLQTLLNATLTQLQKLRQKISNLKSQQKASKHRDPIIEASTPTPPSNEQKIRVEFSMSSVAKATLVVLGLLILVLFLYGIKDILIIIFISLFLSAALDSIVDHWQSKGLPRYASVLLIYLIFFVVLALFISTLVPLVVHQLLELARTLQSLVMNISRGPLIENLPYSQNIQSFINDFLHSIDQETLTKHLQTALEQVAFQLQGLAGNTWNAIKILFNGLMNAVLILVLTFFMVVDEDGIEGFFSSLFPSKHARYIAEKSEAIKEKIGFWLRGQLKLMLAIAALTFIGLSILRVDYALTLALMAGMMELVPVIGPIVAAVPAVLIGLNTSISLTFWIFLFYILIQQFENHIIVPFIMNRAVGLSPLIIIIGMLIGYNFLGIVGIIISVPLATAISIFINDYSTKSK